MIKPWSIGLFVVFVCVTQSFGQDGPNDPIVRVDVAPKSTIVGQPIDLRITVLSPTWFLKPPVFSSFEIRNAVTRLPPNASFATSERINGATWSGVSRVYKIYPMVGVSYELSGQSVAVTYADPDTSKPVEFVLPVPILSFSGAVPKGAESLDPFLAGSNFTLTQEVDGQTRSIEVGAAIVRTVSARIEGMPVMFVPQLIDPSAVSGVSAMARQPAIEEKPGDRGGPVISSRTESTTYVFEEGGDLVLPAISFSWWNIETQKIETAAVPKIEISVIMPDPSAGKNATEKIADAVLVAPRWVLAGFGILTVFLTVILGNRKRITTFIANYRRARQASEQACFRRLTKAVSNGPIVEIDRAIRAWTAHFSASSTIQDLARDATLDDVVGNWARMIEGLYGLGRQSESNLSQDQRVQLANNLKSLRETLLKKRSLHKRDFALRSLSGALNP